MSEEDEKIWLVDENGRKLFIYKTEKCDMEKELNETIQKLQIERQADKERIKELEEQVKMLDKAYSGAIKESKQYFDIVKDSIPKEQFANSICSNDKNLSYANMTECERYGITWGCDEDCPVFKRKECELQEENEKLFNKVVE